MNRIWASILGIVNRSYARNEIDCRTRKNIEHFVSKTRFKPQ